MVQGSFLGNMNLHFLSHSSRADLEPARLRNVLDALERFVFFSKHVQPTDFDAGDRQLRNVELEGDGRVGLGGGGAGLDADRATDVGHLGRVDPPHLPDEELGDRVERVAALRGRQDAVEDGLRHLDLHDDVLNL